jgi:hypothetical protein
MTDMTITEAADAFEQDPNAGTAAMLLRIATEYWNDGMISAKTLQHYSALAAEWLVD